MKTLFYLIFCGLIVSCSMFKKSNPIPAGATQKKISIYSEPTSARIFIQDHYIGKTPLKTTLFYTKEQFVNIKAEPIFANQLPQNIYLRIPPIPERMTIYMHHRTRSKVQLEEAEESNVEELINQVQTVVEIDTVLVEKPITVPSVYFPTDISEVQADQLDKISHLADILKKYKNLQLKIIGFADERGDFEYNKILAMKRAKAVRNKLIEYQIERFRLKLFSRGEQVTFDENGQKLELQRHRTVEFQITEAGE